MPNSGGLCGRSAPAVSMRFKGLRRPPPNPSRTRAESAAACRKVGAVWAREQSAACWILRRLPDPYPAVGRAESGRPRCHERPSDYHETLCYIRLRLPSYRYRGMWAAQLSLDAYTGLSTCRIRMATSTPSMEAIRNRPKT